MGNKESRSNTNAPGVPNRLDLLPSPLLTTLVWCWCANAKVPELRELQQHAQYYIYPALTISCDEISIRLMQ